MQDTKDVRSITEPLRDKYARGELKTLEPFLPFFKIKGELCSLEDFVAFEPAFSVDVPIRTVWRTARQMGKSVNVNGLAPLIMPFVVPSFSQLTVTPRFSQAQWLASETVGGLIKNCLIKNLLVDSESTNTQATRSLMNDNKLVYTFAFLDCDRVRGLSADVLRIDECQDINWGFLPVLEQIISQSEYNISTYTGTPKSSENVLEWLWNQSSQAVWTTRCSHCNHWNHASTAEDLLDMIGEKTVICAKCGRPIDPALDGQYVHAHPERRWEFRGFTMSQPIHPGHYRKPHKWRELLKKRDSYPDWMFYNEVLGECKDSASRLLPLSSLRPVCCGGKNDINTAARLAHKCQATSIGVDWGGGGNNKSGEISYPAVVLSGLLPGHGDVVQTLYVERLNRQSSVEDTIKRVSDLYAKLRPNYVAHDFGGAGNVWEWTLCEMGVPIEKIVPFTYVNSSHREVVYLPDAGPGSRVSYSLDKTRSLVVLATMIKSGKMLFPEYASLMRGGDDIKANPLYEFTQLYLERMERPRGAALMSVKTAAGESTDVVNAVNYAATALWLHMGRYPNVSEALNLRWTRDQVDEFSPEKAEWNV